MNNKICNYCNKNLPHTSFSIDKSKRYGISTFCKACKSAKEKERFMKNYTPDLIEVINGEIWKHIDDMPYGYMISNLGRCKSLARLFRRSDKLLKAHINEGGYPYYVLGKKRRRLHRLLGIYFIPNPNNYPVINHIDANKLNYSLSNLEWTTHLGNTLHKVRLGLHNPCIGEKNGSAKLTNDQVKMIYLSDCKDADLARAYNVTQTTIYQIKKKLKWTGITNDLD